MESSRLPSVGLEIANYEYGQIYFPANDGMIGYCLREFGEWCPLEIEIMKALTKPGATVIDVGAFIGSHTIALAKHIGPEGVVYAFEPNTAIFEILKKNIDLNGLSQVKAYRLALGETAAAIVASAPSLNQWVNFGEFDLKPPKAGDPSQSIEIRTLDSYELRQCDFIKADVELAEIKVLRGAETTLKKFSPSILIEVDDKTSEESIEFLEARGYRLYWVFAKYVRDHENFLKNKSMGDINLKFSQSILAVPQAMKFETDLPSVTAKIRTPTQFLKQNVFKPSAIGSRS